MIQGWPNALVHLAYPNVHRDEAKTKFVFHCRAKEYTVNLDWAGMPHRYRPVFGRARGRSIVLQIMPYIHDVSLNAWSVITLDIPSTGCDFVRSATTSGPHGKEQERKATDHAGLHSE